jgi:hypothetical protein
MTEHVACLPVVDAQAGAGWSPISCPIMAPMFSEIML